RHPQPRVHARGREHAAGRYRVDMATSRRVDALTPVAGRPVDGVFFVLGGAAAVWLAWVLVRQSFAFGWWQLLFAVGFWLALAYIVLPRLHRILTAIYVPDYFIGRTRT